MKKFDPDNFVPVFDTQVNGNADIESLLSDLDCSTEVMQAQEPPNGPRGKISWIVLINSDFFIIWRNELKLGNGDN